MEFEDLFATPPSLPPHQFFNHSIHLKPNVESVNLRAYRYSPVQKAKIEKLIKDIVNLDLTSHYDRSITQNTPWSAT